MSWDTKNMRNGDYSENTIDAYFQLDAHAATNNIDVIDAQEIPINTIPVDAQEIPINTIPVDAPVVYNIPVVAQEIPVDAQEIKNDASRYNGINVNIVYDLTKNRRLCIEIANMRRPPQFKSESMYIASMFLSIGNEMKRRGMINTWFNINCLNKIVNGLGIFREFMSKGALQYRVKMGFPIFDSYTFSGRRSSIYVYRFSADCLNFFNNYHNIPMYSLPNPDIVRRLVDKSHYVTNLADIQLATVDFSVDYARILNNIGCTK
jgi:hypothetical protein